MSNKTTELLQKTICFHGIWAWLLLIVVAVAGVVLCYRLLWRFMQGPRYRKPNRIDGKVVIITGCNTGIGKETALELARRGARIYMACRDAARCEEARIDIIERTGNQNIYNRTLDLASLKSVRNFASRFLAEEGRLDILINNAGVMAMPRTITVDGYEQQLAVNHLGHFLLTNLLLPTLKASAPSRIVNLSSIAYIFGRIHKDDLNSEKTYTKFSAYTQSKLANILFTRKLAKLLKDTGVTTYAVHPGVVATELMRYHEMAKWFWNSLFFLLKMFIKTPRSGAQTSIRCALDPALEKSSGQYYADSMRYPLLPKARDNEMADWLWLESEIMVGLRSRSAKDTSIEINNL